MKKSHKIISLGLVCLIPLGLLAHDEQNDDNKYYKHTLDLNGANYMFEGDLQSKPLDKFSGVWTISGIDVMVDDSTVIYQEDEKIKKGDELYITAKRENGKIKAMVIEQD